MQNNIINQRFNLSLNERMFSENRPSLETINNNLIYNSNNPNIHYFNYTFNLTNENNENVANSILFPPVSLLQSLINQLLIKNNKHVLSNEEFNNLITEKKDNLDECPICYNESNKYIEITKCQHKFCENCIKTWLLENAKTCPLCRTILSN